MKKKTAEELTNERGAIYGSFEDHARVTVRLKAVLDEELQLRHGRGQEALDAQQYEGLHMIFHKIGRIVAGDPNYQDNWDDIAGYAHIANKEF